MYEGRLTYRHLPVSNTKGLFFDQNPSVASCLIWSQSPYLDLLDPTWSSHSPPVLLWPHFLLAFIYSSSHWPSYCSWKVLCTLSLSEPSSCPSSWNILSSKSCLSLSLTYLWYHSWSLIIKEQSLPGLGILYLLYLDLFFSITIITI